MIKRPMALISLIMTFAALWIPLGQQEFLIENWVKIGVFMAPFLLFVAVAFRSDEACFPDVRTISLILLLAYIVHQFEEHWVDVIGNRYAFKPFLNNVILDRLGATEGATGPLSDVGVYVINTALVWLLAGLAIWRAPEHVFPALCMVAIVLVNACSHIVVATSTLDYNPGLLTSVVVFLPVSMWAYTWMIRSGAAAVREVTASLIWGLLAHVVMIAGMIASGWFQLFPEPVYLITLIGLSISPAFLYLRPA